MAHIDAGKVSSCCVPAPAALPIRRGLARTTPHIMVASSSAYTSCLWIILGGFVVKHHAACTGTEQPVTSVDCGKTWRDHTRASLADHVHRADPVLHGQEL